MKTNVKGRILAWILTFMLIVTYMPQVAFATDTVEPNASTAATLQHDRNNDTSAAVNKSVEKSETTKSITEKNSATEETVQNDEQSLVDRALELMKMILDDFDITEGMTEEEIAKAIQYADVENSTWDAMDEIEQLATEATESEKETLLAEKTVETFTSFYLIMQRMNSPAVMAEPASIESVTPVDGVQLSASLGTVAESKGNMILDNGGVLATAEGYTTTACGQTVNEASTLTITVTNTSGKVAIISFDWLKNAVASFTIAGTEVSGEEGSFTSAELAAGETIELKIKSNKGAGNQCSVFFSNIKCEAVTREHNVTVDYNSDLGTVTLNGTEIAANTATLTSAAYGINLKATPAAGKTFVGWVDADGKFINSETTYTGLLEGDFNIKAVFADKATDMYYLAGGELLTNDLNEATEKAAAMTTKTVVAVMDGTVPAGDYTIPADVTLLIPFDAANTLYTTEPKSIRTYTTPTAYRTLTLAEGVNITVNGAISLSAKHFAAGGGQQGSGAPTGPVSFINMEGGSSITVNDGGALYAYGFITGSGAITAKSGAVVYENFQFEDFRGGTQTLDMKNGVFPLSQYYVQNIEVPLTLEAGAKEYSYTSLYMSYTTFSSSVAFISDSEAMFNLTSGSVTKMYDGAKDRLVVYSDNATMSISPINMKVSVQSLNSAKYELPINGNITVDVRNNSSVTISQDIALLPGSQIIVNEGSTCTLAAGTNAYVYDADEWGTFCGSYDAKFYPVSYAPGKKYTRTEADLVDATILVNGELVATDGLAYTTAGGANIYSEGTGKVIMKPGTETNTYQLIQQAGTYKEIPLTPAKLKNADGTFVYVEPDSSFSEAYTTTYTYENGKWVCGHDGKDQVTAKEPTCTEPGSKVDYEDCPYCTYRSLAKEDVIPATGHTEVVDAAVAPKCEATGLTEGKHCSVCNEVLAAQEVVNALGHIAGEQIIDTAAGCTTKGAYHTECTGCGMTMESGEIPETGHDYKSVVTAPTCTEGGFTTKTCENCDDVQITDKVDATGHSWDNGTVTTAAKCEEDGVKTFTCGTCKATKTEPIAQTGHSLKETVVAPTCTEDGYTDHVCQNEGCDYSYQNEQQKAPGHKEVTFAGQAPNCTEVGYKDGVICEVCEEVLVAREEVPALGHTEVVDAAVAPKCEATGLTEGKHCERCKEVLAAQKEVAATGHTEVVDAAVAPECEATGLTEGKHCEVCDKVMVAQEVVPAKGHTEVIDKAVAPDCENTGLTEGKHCSVCDKVLVAQEEVTAQGHKAVTDAAKDPTCTETGITEGSHCEICGEVIVKQNVVPALKHIEIVDEAVNPTCTKTGLTIGKHCDRCGVTLVKQEVVSAKGHTEVIDKAVAATCTEDGKTEGKHCGVCGTVLVSQKPVLAGGHKYGDDIIDKAPKCEETGLKHKKCSVCEHETEQEIIAELGHNIIQDDGEAPTCTEKGYASGGHCDRCDYVFGGGVIDALGHKEVTDAAVAATCTEPGKTEGKHCSVCNEVLVAQETVDKLGHKEVIDKAVAPTCTATGLTEGKHCGVCGEILKAQETVDAAGHAYKDVVTAPTCTDAGYTTHTCEKCGDAYTDSKVTKLDHDYKKVVKEQTCTEGGYTEYTCQRDKCGHSYREDVTEKLGHKSVTDPAKQPTCTETGLSEGSHCERCNITLVAQTTVKKLGHEEVKDPAKAPTCEGTGLTEGSHCSRCDEVLAAQEEVEATGHEYKSEVIDPTCTEKGCTLHVCQNKGCDKSYKDNEKDALGHKEMIDKAVAADCENTGLTEGKHCDTCGEVLVKQETAPAKGHTTAIDKAVAAGCETTGLTAGTHCSVCEKVLIAQEKTEPVGHDYNKTVTKPTCTEDGYTTYICKRAGCGNEKKDDFVDKLGHKEVADDAVEPTCVKEGKTAGTHCETCGEVMIAQEVIPATGHTEEVIEGKAATCTEKGITDGSKCTVCKELLTAQEVIPAKGHDLTTYEAVEPTCTEDGRTAGEECSRCDYKEGLEKEDKLGHDLSKVKEIPATCTEGGRTEGTECSRCDYFTGLEETEKLGHDMKAVETIEATCTEDGRTAGEECSRCDRFTGLETVEKLGHDMKAAEAIEATCIEDGRTAGEKCSRCDYFTGLETVEKLGHDMKTVIAVKATCTEDGHKAGAECSRCDHFTGLETVEKLGHDMKAVAAIEATCTENGRTAGEECSRCDYSTGKQLVEKLGHDLVEIERIRATCTEDGRRAGAECSRCDYTTGLEKIEKLGHRMIEVAMVEATCTEDGHEAGAECSRCDYFTGLEKIEKLGHTIVTDEGREVTCTDNGFTEGSHCSVCEEVFETQKELLAAGHKAVTDAAVAATCTATGWTEGSHCEVCGTVLVKQKKVPVAGHEYGERRYQKPTPEADGGWYKNCGVCGDRQWTEVQTYVEHVKEEVKETKMTIRPYYTGGGIRVTWTSPNIKVDGYEIWRSKTGKAGSFKKIKTTGTDVRQWTNSGLKLQSRFFYKVRGYKMVDGKKVYTQFSAKGYRYVLNAANAKLANAIEKSNSIKAKKAVKVKGGIKITWSKDSKVKCTKYSVWRSTSKNGPYTKIATTKNMSYTDKAKKLKNGKRYYYKVVGYRSFGKACPKTNPSNAVSAVR